MDLKIFDKFMKMPKNRLTQESVIIFRAHVQMPSDVSWYSFISNSEEKLITIGCNNEEGKFAQAICYSQQLEYPCKMIRNSEYCYVEW